MMKNTVLLGKNQDNKYVPLPWKNSNGILIAGISGSGKTQTAALLITEYVYNGTKIILCDYNAAMGTSETLLDRVDYLSDAFIMKPATDKETIAEYIEWIKDFGDKRYKGQIPKEEHYPLLFVIDEFPAFVKNHVPAEITVTKLSGDKFSAEGETREIERKSKYIDDLLSAILALRKVEIHFMLIGQEWAQAGTTGVRALRSNMTDRIYHRMDAAQAKLFGFTQTQLIRQIENLPVGRAMYKDHIVRVPLLNDKMMNDTVARLGVEDKITIIPKINNEYIWSDEDRKLYEQMYQKYWPRIQDRAVREYLSQIDSKESQINMWLQYGKSQNWIEKNVKGSTMEIRKIIEQLKGEAS